MSLMVMMTHNIMLGGEYPIAVFYKDNLVVELLGGVDPQWKGQRNYIYLRDFFRFIGL